MYVTAIESTEALEAAEVTDYSFSCLKVPKRPQGKFEVIVNEAVKVRDTLRLLRL